MSVIELKHLSRVFSIAISAVSVVVVVGSAVRAQVPRTIAFQGVLTNAAGVRKPDGSYTVTIRLYNHLPGPTQLWIESKSITVSGGRGIFATALGSATPFPASLAFDQQYWIGVQVEADAEMLPRLPLQSVPYALNIPAATLSLPFTGSTSIASPGAGLLVTNTSSGGAIEGVATQTGVGVLGMGSSNAGVYGQSASSYGVYGTSEGALAGVAGNNTGTGAGVSGTSSNFAGVYGVTSTIYSAIYGHATGGGTGVLGDAVSNPGVYGSSTGSNGVYGQTTSSSAAIYGNHTGANVAAGLEGHSASYNGVIGFTTAAGQAGVAGVSNGASAGNGLYGRSDNGGTGASASSNTGIGVYGESTSSGGVGGHGVLGKANVPQKAGVWGENNSQSAWGVFGTSTGAGSAGVQGAASGDSASVGVYGSAIAGTGVVGSAGGAGGVGVRGQGANGSIGQLAGFYGTEAGAVVGVANSANTVGVIGVGVAGLVGSAGTFYGSVYVEGALNVSGHLTSGALQVVGSKDFKIDHPMDPANKYLVHSCAEGPEALNLYKGIAITGTDGTVEVVLPSYFEAENRDFGYQFTCIGQFAQAIVGEEVKGNKFTIRTDKPNVKVSWQVSGVRNDAYMQAHPTVVEPMKTGEARGRYLTPELYGQPASKGMTSRLPAGRSGTVVH